MSSHGEKHLTLVALVISAVTVLLGYAAFHGGDADRTRADYLRERRAVQASYTDTADDADGDAYAECTTFVCDSDGAHCRVAPCE